MAFKSSNRQQSEAAELDTLHTFRKAVLESRGGEDCLLDDDFLHTFLKARNYDLEQAIRLLRNYFAAKKAAFPKVPLVPSSFVEALNAQYICPLRGRDYDGRRIFWVRMGLWDVSQITFAQYMASLFLVVSETLRNSKDQALGYTTITDLGGFGLSHVRRIGILESKNISKLVHGAFPVKVKQLHFIRVPQVFGLVWAMGKNFISHKIRNRHKFHGYSLDSLHKAVNPDILPEELGGPLEFTEAVDMDILENVFNNEEYYQRLDAAKFEYEETTNR